MILQLMELYAKCHRNNNKKLSMLYQGTYCFLDTSFYLGIRIVVTNFYGEYRKAINTDTSDTAVCPIFPVLCHCGEQC